MRDEPTFSHHQIVQGHIIALQKDTYPSILDYLARICILDDGHISSGMTYLDWKEAYYALSGAKTSRFNETANGYSAEEKGSKYLITIRLIGLNYQQDIEHALKIQEITRKYRDPIYEVRYRYLKAFDRLGKAISEANNIANS